MKKKNKKLKITYSEQFLKSFDRLFSNNPIYAIPRFFGDIKLEIKWAWQRVFRGFDDRWYWSLYGMITEIIPKCIRKIRKDGTGYPGNITNKEWKIILKKIEDGFIALNKIETFGDCKYNSKKYKQRLKKYEEGMKLFLKHFRNLWD